MQNMQEKIGSKILPETLKTKYILDYNEYCEIEVSSPFDDSHGCAEPDMDQWVNEVEPLFTAREIFSLFEAI